MVQCFMHLTLNFIHCGKKRPFPRDRGVIRTFLIYYLKTKDILSTIKYVTGFQNS